MLALIIAMAACSSARADDPWKPILDLFRRKPAPVEITPLPPTRPDDAAAAIERALLDADLQAAVKRAQEAAERAEEAAKAAVPPPEPPRDAKSPAPKPKIRARPLDIRPKVTAAECAQIGIGIGLIGKDGVKREAIARGHSAAEIDAVQKACGF